MQLLLRSLSDIFVRIRSSYLSSRFKTKHMKVGWIISAHTERWWSTFSPSHLQCILLEHKSYPKISILGNIHFASHPVLRKFLDFVHTAISSSLYGPRCCPQSFDLRTLLLTPKIFGKRRFASGKIVKVVESFCHFVWNNVKLCKSLLKIQRETTYLPH